MEMKKDENYKFKDNFELVFVALNLVRFQRLVVSLLGNLLQSCVSCNSNMAIDVTDIGQLGMNAMSLWSSDVNPSGPTAALECCPKLSRRIKTPFLGAFRPLL